MNITVQIPTALRRLTAEAMHDIAHYLRPAHLAQLRKIIDDPESSGNDRFVALDLLKNVNISAGGVLPMCQDTGTAIIMGKKGRMVFTAGDDEAAKELFRTGKTMGVFYTESPASRLLCAKSRADTFELLVLNTSMIRPASNKYIQLYLERLRKNAHRWAPGAACAIASPPTRCA